MDCSTPVLPVHHNSRSPPKPMSIESVMPSNHLILCCPLLLLPSIFPSIRVFSNESALRIRWPKYWSFSFSISPSNENSGLISFRMDWLISLSPRDSQESDRMWSTGKGKGKPRQYSCLENPMKSMKRERLHKAEQSIKKHGSQCIYLI